MAVKPSQYVTRVPLPNGQTLAWHAWSGALSVWSESEARVFDSVRADTPEDDPVVRDLLFGGYLVRAHVDELADLQAMYEATRGDPRALTLTIAPTLNCNFACDYCFQGPNKPQGAMGVRVQEAIVAFVTRAAPSLQRVGVAWYGGEPLLQLPIIAALSMRLSTLTRDWNVRYDSMIVSNGAGLTVAAARALVDAGVRTAQITLDGDAASHDQRRPLRNGRGTFERIVANLEDVASHVTDLALSLRVNVDRRNIDGAHALIHALAARGLGNRQNLRLYFSPVEAMTSGCHDVAADCLGKVDYGRVEVALQREAFELGLAGLPLPPRLHGVCGAVRPLGMVVLPDGSLHKCWDTVTTPDEAIGTIFDVEGALQAERAMRWHRWSPFDEPGCRTCDLLPACAGACAYKFLHAGATRGEAAGHPCPSWRYNLKERLVLRAGKSGVEGVSWSPPCG